MLRIETENFLRAFGVAFMIAAVFIISPFLIKESMDVALKDIITTMAKMSIFIILGYEVWDTYKDKQLFFSQLVPFGMDGQYKYRVILSALIMLITIAVVSFCTGGMSPSVIVVGLLISAYVILPATGDDYWLLALWLGCVAASLATESMAVSEFIECQAFVHILGGFL